MKALARDIAIVAVELVALAALAYGSWLAWHPAGFIVPGGVVLSLSIVADIRRNRPPKES